MTRMLDLNCLVLDGDASINRIFSIQAPDTDKIATLKEKIKEKKHPGFEHIPADNLELWHVSISIEELSETYIRPPTTPPLSPVKRLSGLFPNAPLEDHLHIIVQAPNMAGAS